MSEQTETMPADSGRIPSRARLPNTRCSVTHRFEVGQYEGYITVGLYDDGNPGEVFVKIAKHGSTISGLLDTIAVLTSFSTESQWNRSRKSSNMLALNRLDGQRIQSSSK
jgi:ribonucleoside-diphosphate reductase alpha chain